MKALLHILLVPVWFAAVAAFAGNHPRVDITVASDPAGAVVFNGQANAKGTFATSALRPGNYIVQFNAKNPAAMKGKEFFLAAQAGKTIVTANAVPGEKFSGGGVAMKIKVAKAGKLIGNVSSTMSMVASTERKEAVRANVKIMNGKRYVWVPGSIESQMSGKWVEAGTESAVLKNTNRKGSDSEALLRLQEHSGNSGVQPDGFGLPAAKPFP